MQKKRNIAAGDDIKLLTPKASIRVKANLTEIVPPGVVSMYHAYPTADVNTLIEPDYRDPISGFPVYKALLCDVIKRIEGNDSELEPGLLTDNRTG